jgi:hypothetical protein
VSLYALLSAGGSPGVTTAALALTLGWPSQVILAECDPSGGDVLAGLFAGHLPATSGLLPLAVEAGRSQDAATAALWRQLIPLDDEHSRYLLAGISDPRQETGLAPAWAPLAAAFATLPADVIADCGRLDASGGPRPVFRAASLVVLVLRPTLRQVSKARPRIEMLAQLGPVCPPLVVLLVGEGTYSPHDVSRALGLPLAGSLPHDRKTAGVLSDGTGSRRALSARPLIRAAGVTGRALREAAAGAGSSRRPPPGPPPRDPGQSPPGRGQHRLPQLPEASTQR